MGRPANADNPDTTVSASPVNVSVCRRSEAGPAGVPPKKYRKRKKRPSASNALRRRSARLPAHSTLGETAADQGSVALRPGT